MSDPCPVPGCEHLPAFIADLLVASSPSLRPVPVPERPRTPRGLTLLSRDEGPAAEFYREALGEGRR